MERQEGVDGKRLKGNTKITAGKKWTDEQKRIHYEGISFLVPGFVDDDECIRFAITKFEMNGEDFLMSGHTHQTDHKEVHEGGCSLCEGGIEVEVPRERLATWTGISGGSLEKAVSDGCEIGYTFNFLARCPRIIELTKKDVTIILGSEETIDAFNTCNVMFKGKFPLDKNG